MRGVQSKDVGGRCRHLASAHLGAARFLPGHCIWGMLKAWEAQSRHLTNHSQGGLALAGAFAHQILLHGQGLPLKAAAKGLMEQITKAEAKAKAKAHAMAGEAKGVVKAKGLEASVKKVKGKQ